MSLEQSREMLKKSALMEYMDVQLVCGVPGIFTILSVPKMSLPPNSVLDVAQTGEGAFFKYAVYLEYKPFQASCLHLIYVAKKQYMLVEGGGL